MTSIDFLCVTTHNNEFHQYQHSQYLADPENYNPLAHSIRPLTDIQLATKDYSHRPIDADIPTPIPCRIHSIPDLPRRHAHDFVQRYINNAWRIELALSNSDIAPEIKVQSHYDIFHHNEKYYILCDSGVIRRVPDSVRYVNEPSDDPVPERWQRAAILSLQYGDVPITTDEFRTSPAVMAVNENNPRLAATRVPYIYDDWLTDNFLYPYEPRNTDSKIRQYLYQKFSPYSMTASEIKLLCVQRDLKTIDLVTLTYHDFIDTWTIPDLPVTLAKLDYPIVRI